jgi:Flp pilus assembly protein TadB
MISTASRIGLIFTLVCVAVAGVIAAVIIVAVAAGYVRRWYHSREWARFTAAHPEIAAAADGSSRPGEATADA